MLRCASVLPIRSVRYVATVAKTRRRVKLSIEAWDDSKPLQDDHIYTDEDVSTPTMEWSSILPPLPPPDKWETLYPVRLRNKYNCVLSHPNTARLVAANFLRDGSTDTSPSPLLCKKWAPSKCPGKVIIEAYPGPGALTRALLDHPPEVVERVIALEPDAAYRMSLESLARADSRLTVLPDSGYLWDSYDKIRDLGLLDGVDVMPWEELHPKLHFIAHIPMKTQGEQLLSQFLRLIPIRGWLFKYGRVPFSLLMGQSLWERVTSERGSVTRCKLTVVSETVAKFFNSVPSEYLLPYESHFFPPPTARDIVNAEKAHEMGSFAVHNKRKRVGHPFVASTFLPLREQLILPNLLDTWDYVIRMLYILRSQPLETSISQLGPGASNLLKDLGDVDLTLPANRLTSEDFAKIVAAFDDWPFAPSVYLTYSKAIEERE